jgi:hypothetical protein
MKLLHPVVFLCAMMLASCGGRSLVGAGDDDSGSGVLPILDASPALQKACTDEETAYCELRQRCAGSFNDYYDSMAACVSRSTDACILNLSAPQNARNAATAEACAAAYATESCTDWWDDNSPATCRAIPGPRALGAACGVDSQCASTFCGIEPGSMCGTCQDPPGAGTVCQSTSDCWYDLSCPIVAPSSNGVCTPRVVPGGACDDYHFCQGGYSCIGADTQAGITGSCQVSATTVGTTCNYATGPGCDNTLSLYCASGSCQPEPYVAGGQPCGYEGNDFIASCQGGGMCVTVSPATSGTCVAPAADGAACDLVNGPPCLPDSRCITDDGSSGTCAFIEPSSCG